MNEMVMFHTFSHEAERNKREHLNVRARCAPQSTCNSQYTCSQTSWFEFASLKLYCSRRSGANRKHAIKIVPSVCRCRPGTNSGQNYVSKLDIPGHCAGIIGNPWRAIVCRTRMRLARHVASAFPTHPCTYLALISPQIG